MHFSVTWFLLFTAMKTVLIISAFRDIPGSYSSLNESKLENSRHTVFEKSLANVLARKKRGFVFFKGAVVVLTQVLSKHIVAKSPRGVLHSSEVDIFYDLPILIEGWKKPLDVFVNRTKGVKKKTDKISNNFIEDNDSANIGVINASAFPWNHNQFHKTYYEPHWNRFVWNANRNSWNGISFPNRKYYFRKPSIDNGPWVKNYQRKNFNPTQLFYTKRPGKISYHYPSKTYNYLAKSQDTRRKYQQIKNFKHQPTQRKQQTVKTLTHSWKGHEHREYRERRQIFEHVESFGKKLGFSLRSCILRAICEIKTELLPEGESFINDVARILFTIPTNHDNKNDDFVQMALETGVDCVRRFMVSCPHSPLKYFFNNFRATHPPMNNEDMMRSLMYAR